MDVEMLIGFVAIGFVIASLSMRTMVPLRVVGIASNVSFITYGMMIGSLPVVILHTLLFPLNIYRLHEMLSLLGKVKQAARGDLSMDWLKPFMDKRAVTAGETLFRKGDEANAMLFLVNGGLHLSEIGVDLPPGSIVGEIGLLAPGGARTQTLVCTESGQILEISYGRVKELYYQNPAFGFYFLRLSTSRLFENIGRLEASLAEREQEIQRLKLHHLEARDTP